MNQQRKKRVQGVISMLREASAILQTEGLQERHTDTQDLLEHAETAVDDAIKYAADAIGEEQA